MTATSTELTATSGHWNRNPFGVVIGLAVLLWAVLMGAAVLSPQFSYGSPVAERPIWPVFGLFALATLLYLAALRFATRVCEQKKLIAAIWFFAVALRLAFLFTEPILEIDLYRYIWDGNVVAAGVNPYIYSPLDVLTTETAAGNAADLARLIELRQASPALDTILSRIHFSELPSPYPPVSQAVFALAAATTPEASGLGAHLVIIKAWLLIFDLATIAGVLGILRLTGLHPGWAVAYAWCPLVIKEFANSGHLDAIAVCLTTFAFYAALRFRRSDPTEITGSGSWSVAAWFLLSLGVGAKLYPLVLAPLMAVWTLRQCGWRFTMVGLTLFCVVTGTTLSPMAVTSDETDNSSGHAQIVGSAPAGQPPLPTDLDADASARQDLPPDLVVDPEQTDSGLAAFLTQWRMNDFLFHLTEANLQPEQEGGDRSPWFAVTPDRWRRAVCQTAVDSVGISPETAAFAVARLLTVMLFGVLVAVTIWRLHRQPSDERFCEYCFLTLAWFWLLAPTQNPWYWTWVIPLLPFARNRAWFALSGLVMIYYLRFWCDSYWFDRPGPLGTDDGHQFFDHVVSWIEYAPWFVWLFAEWFVRKVRGANPDN